MRNLHNILLQEDGIEAWCLFRLWEKLRIRASEYKNHRIFTLRCLHNNLIPVSIKLKSTLKSTRANKILRKAEKDHLQARIKSINFTLDNTSKQLEECRSQLAAIISTQRLRECQDFVDKVGEIRFNKLKQRQLNKFNLLTIRKEGNITRSNTNLNNHNLNSQTNSPVNQFSQAREGSTPPQASPPLGKTTGLPWQVLPMEKLALLCPPHRLTVSLGKEALLPRLVLTLPGKTTGLPRLLPPPLQASALLPSSEGSRPPNPPSTQAGQASNPNNTLRQGSRCPQGIGPPRPSRRSTPPPRKAIIPPPPC